jgi:hypothetical protein
MKIGFVSDTHGDIGAWKEAWNYLKDCNFLLHAGDVLYHGAFNPILKTYSPKDLAEALNQLPVPIYFARGNCDSDVDTLALKYPLESPFLHLILSNGSIIVHHGHRYSDDKLLSFAQKEKAKLVVRGHTHLYQLEERDGVVFLNPGSPSLPKENRPPTVALWEGGRLMIINISQGEEVASFPVDL